MATGFLRVQGKKIVDESGNRVLLRGSALGGWLCMENFLTGFPGTESSIRAALLDVLGQEKYDHFFDRFLHHMFTDADALYFKSLGLNALRLPFSHKHLDDDMNPRILKEEGFRHLDRVIEICARHGIYTILDMHTVPGCQNPDWHSDNNTSYAAFWDFKDHQDRTVWLWERIAERYKDNPWVAGYNPINEPCDPQQTRLPAFYKRLEKAVRAIDPRHILFLDGNTFAMEWKGFKEVLPNSSYAIHDYSILGFRLGGMYKGTPEQKAKLRQQLERKCEFHREYQTSIWNGEFGPQWETDDPNAAEMNVARAGLLAEQIRLYDEVDMDWSIWVYKDIGRMGMVHTSPYSAWNKLVGDFAQRKIDLQIESATQGQSVLDGPIDEIVAWVDKVSPTANATYPPNWNTKQHILRQTLHTFVATSFCAEFAELFRGKTLEELEELASSFNLDKCSKRKEINDVLQDVTK